MFGVCRLWVVFRRGTDPPQRSSRCDVMRLKFSKKLPNRTQLVISWQMFVGMMGELSAMTSPLFQPPTHLYHNLEFERQTSVYHTKRTSITSNHGGRKRQCIVMETPWPSKQYDENNDAKTKRNRWPSRMVSGVLRRVWARSDEDISRRVLAGWITAG